MRPQKTPRGTVVSTGEDLPNGHSVRARLLIAEVGPDDINLTRLTKAQHLGITGHYARAMAGYIQWLSGRYQEIQDGLQAEFVSLRSSFSGDLGHTRTPSTFAHHLLGFRYFLKYATEVNAISAVEADAIDSEVVGALTELARAQEGHQAAADPVNRFFTMLSSAISSGSAHLANLYGRAPQGDSPSAWGWRSKKVGLDEEWQPQGSRVGWIDGDDLFIEMTAALKAANAMTDFNSGITIGEQTLVKRMAQRGLLVSQEPKHNKIRKNIEGYRKRVAHTHISSLMSEKVVHSVHESEKPKDTNGFSANKSGPVPQSNRSIADKSGPDGPLSGTGNSGCEAESVHRMTAAPVENTHENEADGPDGPNGPLISEGETPEESIDDAVSLSEQDDKSESPSDGDAVEREPVGRFNEQLKI